MSSSRAEAARSVLMAIITASVPESPKRTWSSPGSRSTGSSASRSPSGVEKAKFVPRERCAVTAWTTGGKAWPWISAVKLSMQSRRSTPSRSVAQQPLPRGRTAGGAAWRGSP